METLHIEKYYSSMEHLLDVYDQKARKMGFKSESEIDYLKWKSELKEQLKEITGLNRMQACEFEPKLLETVYLDGFKRDKMIIQTEPDVWMTFYVLIPNDIVQNEKRPAVITPHGHDSAGKFSTSGRYDIPCVKEQIGIYNYDYGVKFVNEGYIVFCPDARGFGERREWTKQKDDKESFLSSTCTQLNHMAICLGQSLTAMWTWDLIRLVDYIFGREDCDTGRIACAGLSGGGKQTLWLSAMDERIKCAVISGYFYGYKDSLLKLSDNCACNYVPHLWEYVDICDLGAMIAPRPLLIETGDSDPLNGERGLANVTEQVDITRKAYALLKAEDKLDHHIFKGVHKWDGSKTYDFVKKHL